MPLPLTAAELDTRWDFGDPAASEAAFRALLAEADAESPASAAEVLTQLARALGLQQRFDEAHAALDEAERRLGAVQRAVPDPARRARARLALERGRVVRSAGDPEAAAPHFEAALALAEAGQGGAGHDGLDDDLAYYAVDAAHMLGIVRVGADGEAWNRRAIAMAEAAADPRARRWLGALYNNLGWTLFDLGRFEEALELFERDHALRVAQGRETEAGIARWSAAKALRRLGRVEEALATQRELLGRAERQGNAAEGYGHEEVGECLLALGRAEEAAPHFRRAWERLHEDPWLRRDEPERLARLWELGGAPLDEQAGE